MTRRAPPTHTTLRAAGALVVEKPRFAIVPEWVIDAAISDGAFRLYSLLLHYENGSGSRMPSRQTPARRLRRSVDGLRPALQAQARAELTAEGMPVIQSTVARCACAILDLHQLQ